MSNPTGSLRILMDGLVALEAVAAAACAVQVPDGVEPRVYRWRPVGQIETPCIYNWIEPSTFEQHDLVRYSDTIALTIRVGIGRGDQDEEMALVESYTDVVRSVIDPPVLRQKPLDGAATWAFRGGLRTESDDFNGVPILAIAIPYTFRLDRQLTT